MRLFYVVLSLLIMMPVASAYAEETASSEALQAFAEQVFDIHQRQDKEAFLALIHEGCPAPIAESLDWTFSYKWDREKPYDIRFKAVEEMFDLSMISFPIMPDAAIEYQVWITNDQEEMEYVTGYGVKQVNGDYRIIEYPCYEFAAPE